MAVERILPTDRNPLLEVERAPPLNILVERRCLGQTELRVKPGMVGTSNATKKENLGVLDYAHLRVPLPKDLEGSGIFAAGANRKYPEAYFLMRRSGDGYVSATGMFKAAYPWSSLVEEAAEKDHIKSLKTTSSEEVAGNVWIPPQQALDLADKYGLTHWILALLDPEPIAHGTHDPNKYIASPPPFDTKKYANGANVTPSKPEKMSTRGSRSLRSASPTKTDAPGSARKKATPRRTRGRKTATTSSREGVDELAGEQSVGSGSVNGDAVTSTSTETVKVEVTDTKITDSDGDQTETTHVSVQMPAHSPDLQLPNNTDDMIREARRMVDEANRISGASGESSSAAAGRKRKVDELEEDDDGDDGEVVDQPTKRVRLTELELRKEKIKRRALTGIAASLFIGAIMPTIIAAFPWS